MNNNVKITPNSEGNLVTPYAGNSDYGYVMLSQTKSVFKDGWMKESTLRTIIKGEVTALTGFVSANSDLELPGNLVIEEHLENNVPDAISKAHFNEDLPREEQIENYIKRSGNEGVTLNVDGIAILRFTLWDTTGEKVDVTLQHTNIEEVKAFVASNVAVSEEDADL